MGARPGGYVARTPAVRPTRLLCFCAVLLAPAAASAQSVGQTVVLVAGGVGGGLALTSVAIIVPLPIVFPAGAVAGSVAWSVADVRVEPAVLRTPEGERAAGLSLTVAF